MNVRITEMAFRCRHTLPVVEPEVVAVITVTTLMRANCYGLVLPDIEPEVMAVIAATTLTSDMVVNRQCKARFHKDLAKLIFGVPFQNVFSWFTSFGEVGTVIYSCCFIRCSIQQKDL